MHTCAEGLTCTLGLPPRCMLPPLAGKSVGVVVPAKCKVISGERLQLWLDFQYMYQSWVRWGLLMRLDLFKRSRHDLSLIRQEKMVEDGTCVHKRDCEESKTLSLIHKGHIHTQLNCVDRCLACSRMV